MLVSLRCVSVLLSLPRPTPTLSPYTTLFRSCHRIKRSLARRKRFFGERSNEFPRPIANRWSFTIANGNRSALSPRDRKSTRLNSSHLVISYAVFCFQKKNDGTYSLTQTRGQF